MRYALVSDIHANRQAWNAVLSDLTSLDVDRILCLGDVVGYGPEPAAVLESMYRHVDAFVMGNHDAVLCGKMSAENFNSRARGMIEWTASRVSRRGIEFLGRQSLVLTGPGFCCAHGDMAMPGAFRYVTEAADALASWAAAPDPLLFVGHSHVPRIFVLGSSGRPHALPPQDFVLEEGKRFVVNVGSVGFPRDRDLRACYCIYDTEERAVRWRRVPFDLDALRQAVEAAGLDSRQTPLMDLDPRNARPPVREEAFFRPAEDATQVARGVVTTRDLTTLRRRASRWRAAALVSVAAALLATGGAAAVALRNRSFGLAVPAEMLRPRVAAAMPGENLVPRIPAALDDGQAVGWRYTLADRRLQRLWACGSADGGGAFVVTNSSRATVRIEAPPIDLAGLAREKLRMLAAVRRGPDFDGQIELVLDLVDTDDRGRLRRRPNLLRCSPASRRAGGWELAQRTTERPLDRRARQVQLSIEGTFAGSVTIEGITLAFVDRAK